jgi:hypothetical protein
MSSLLWLRQKGPEIIFQILSKDPFFDLADAYQIISHVVCIYMYVFVYISISKIY